MFYRANLFFYLINVYRSIGFGLIIIEMLYWTIKLYKLYKNDIEFKYSQPSIIQKPSFP